MKVTKSDTEDHADTSSQDEYDGEVRCRPCGATKDNYDEDEDTLGIWYSVINAKLGNMQSVWDIRPNVQYPIFINVMFVLENPYHNPNEPNTKTIKEEEEEEEEENDDDDIIEITDVKEKKSFANLKDEVRISTLKPSTIFQKGYP